MGRGGLVGEEGCDGALGMKNGDMFYIYMYFFFFFFRKFCFNMLDFFIFFNFGC